VFVQVTLEYQDVSAHQVALDFQALMVRQGHEESQA